MITLDKLLMKLEDNFVEEYSDFKQQAVFYYVKFINEFRDKYHDLYMYDKKKWYVLLEHEWKHERKLFTPDEK